LAISGDHPRTAADDLAGLLECEGRTKRIGSLDGLRVEVRRARSWVVLTVVSTGPPRDVDLSIGSNRAVGVLHVLPACLVYARPALRWRAGAKSRLRHIELPRAMTRRGRSARCALPELGVKTRPNTAATA